MTQVRISAPRDGFRRAGLSWTREPTVITADMLTGVQQLMLLADPAIVIEREVEEGVWAPAPDGVKAAAVEALARHQAGLIDDDDDEDEGIETSPIVTRDGVWAGPPLKDEVDEAHPADPAPSGESSQAAGDEQKLGEGADLQSLTASQTSASAAGERTSEGGEEGAIAAPPEASEATGSGGGSSPPPPEAPAAKPKRSRKSTSH